MYFANHVFLSMSRPDFGSEAWCAGEEADRTQCIVGGCAQREEEVAGA